MAGKTIVLSAPIKGHRGMIANVTLREPKYADFIDFGMPTTWVALSEGGFSQETPSILGQWIERLADIDPNFISQLCLRDTLALRGAVLNFFIEAAAQMVSKPSTDLPEDLSSNSMSTSGPSTI